MSKRNKVFPTHVEASTPSGVRAWLEANHPTDLKHAPGPWECSVQGDKSIVIWTARGQAVAKVPKSSGLYTQAEVEANAALIAQAPTLLTERDALLGWLKRFMDEWPWGEGVIEIDLIPEARALLAELEADHANS